MSSKTNSDKHSIQFQYFPTVTPHTGIHSFPLVRVHRHHGATTFITPNIRTYSQLFGSVSAQVFHRDSVNWSAVFLCPTRVRHTCAPSRMVLSPVVQFDDRCVFRLSSLRVFKLQYCGAYGPRVLVGIRQLRLAASVSINFGQHSANIGQHSVNTKPTSANIGQHRPTSADIGQLPANFRRTFAELD